MSPSSILPWMAVLAVAAVAGELGPQRGGEGTPANSPGNVQSDKLRFVLLQASTKLPEGVTLYLQDTEELSDRVLLAIASSGKYVSLISLELHAGSEVVFPFQKVNFVVNPAGLTVAQIVLEKKVIADVAAWDRYWLKKKPGEVPPDHPSVKVARFFAITK